MSGRRLLMATVIVSPHNVVCFPEGAGHFWVYMQYVQGLRRVGCDVYWLERFYPDRDGQIDQTLVGAFLERMRRYEMGDRVLLYSLSGNGDSDSTVQPEFISLDRNQAEAILTRADVLVNFHYTIHPNVLARFRRTALVDIDPGLLQVWMSTGRLQVLPHHYYLTTGETVGTPRARFPDCGVRWTHIHPPVCLELWPYVHDEACAAFTTVAGWWAGESLVEIVDGREVLYDNTKRISFLQFAALPRLTPQRLELALWLAENDDADRRLLEGHGWRVHHSREVARTPEMYQAYIQQSRGEFSCAKPSCMKFQSGWVSDRTLCYLASGKPVIVQVSPLM